MHKLSIEEMQRLAAAKGGKCLSNSYVNAQTKLRWQCSEGHRWNATPNSIQQGTWCRICSYVVRADNLRGTLKEAQDIAKKRGGLCLSDTYVNNMTNLKWKCKNGHKWEAAASNIKQGSWCPYCAGRARHTIKDMQKLAAERGGKCLSKKYVNEGTKLKWQCKNGHTWKAKPRDMIHSKTWCPVCSRYANVSEELCRQYFQLLFDEEFPKTRPRWLVDSDGNRLEFDGFCEKLGLAFEFQGRQHFLYVKKFQQKRSLAKIRASDKLKRKICAKRGVILVEIPYTVPYEKLGAFIKRECKKHGFKKLKVLPEYPGLLKSVHPEFLKDMKELAKKMGGRCLSKHYTNVDTKLTWKCAKGHVWKSTPYHVKQRGHWCPYCAGNVKHTIEEMQRIAKKRGGRCLSKVYRSGNKRLQWRCRKGHLWKATPQSVKNSETWCPYCAGKVRLTIDKMKELAARKGGQCLSKRYVNSETKLRWQCSKGHIWNATPDSIISDKWCHYCAHRVPEKLSHIKKIAREKGGKCLSDKYTTSLKKLKWQCAKGHVWEASWSSIKHGNHWCPYCAGIVKLTIEQMQALAKSKGGVCLSKHYVNKDTKLRWKCAKGHT